MRSVAQQKLCVTITWDDVDLVGGISRRLASKAILLYCYVVVAVYVARIFNWGFFHS